MLCLACAQAGLARALSFISVYSYYSLCCIRALLRALLRRGSVEFTPQFPSLTQSPDICQLFLAVEPSQRHLAFWHSSHPLRKLILQSTPIHQYHKWQASHALSRGLGPTLLLPNSHYLTGATTHPSMSVDAGHWVLCRWMLMTGCSVGAGRSLVSTVGRLALVMQCYMFTLWLHNGDGCQQRECSC